MRSGKSQTSLTFGILFVVARRQRQLLFQHLKLKNIFEAADTMMQKNMHHGHLVYDITF
jgi:hypothetical protein